MTLPGVTPEWAAELRRRAALSPQRIVFTQPESRRVLAGAVSLAREGLAHPVLLGEAESLRASAAQAGLSPANVAIVPALPRSDYLELWRAHWASRGIREEEAKESLLSRLHFGQAMMLAGDASAIVCGPRREEPRLLRRLTGETRMRFFLTAVDSSACLVAEPTGVSAPPPRQLSEMALSLSRISRKLFGAAGQVVFLAPDVPVGLEWRPPFRTAREEIETRVREAIFTLQARNAGIRCLHPGSGEWTVGSGREPSLVVLTHARHGGTLFRTPPLAEAVMIGPCALMLGGAYGELSDIADDEAVMNLALVAGLSAATDIS